MNRNSSISRCAKYYIIWLKPNGDIYHKFVSGHYVDYFVGYQNQYGHEIIYIFESYPEYFSKPPFKLRFKRKLISYIEKM